MKIEDLEVKFLKALSHPVRLKIVKKLKKGTLCVCELDKDLEFSQSNLSQHLRILRDASVLTKERDGSRINYSIKDERIIKLLDIVQDIVLKDILDINDKLGG
ncbi:MAG: winged helix-turn-helix transcriptional regulator [Firmicutes bacterium]|nr:winged helix-turn-helix transcriptional regulator [Bacillota bacterium]